MSEGKNPLDYLSEGEMPDEESALEGTTSPVGVRGQHGVVDEIDPVLERRFNDLERRFNDLAAVNVQVSNDLIELLMVDMLEMGDELGRLQDSLTSIYTLDDVKTIAEMKRNSDPYEILAWFEVRYSEAGKVSKTGQFTITSIKNLLNRFQEKLRYRKMGNAGEEGY